MYSILEEDPHMPDMTHLLLDITHRCNLSCSFCIKDTKNSDFEMTQEDLNAVCDHCANLPLSFVRISGGEPLMHPYLRTIVRAILTRLGRPIDMNTNGLLLSQYKDIIPDIEMISITTYPGVNDKVIAEYRDLPNVNIIDRIYWYDLNQDPDWDYQRASRAFDQCVFRQINITGQKVYGCCMGETIARVYGVQGISVELKLGWEEEYQRLDIIPGCQHCCMALREGY